MTSCAIPLFMPSIDDEIRSRTEAFVTSLATVIKQAALEAVSQVLGRGAVTVPSAPAQAQRGRPKKVVPAPAAKAAPLSKPLAKPLAKTAGPAAKAPAAKAPLSKKAAAKRAPGEKRPPAELVKLTERLGEYIRANPGQRIETIGKALSAPTKDLTLPVKKLLAAKKIRSEGLKRATEYFPS
jgi:hypothetical protein